MRRNKVKRRLLIFGLICYIFTVVLAIPPTVHLLTSEAVVDVVTGVWCILMALWFFTLGTIFLLSLKR